MQVLASSSRHSSREESLAAVMLPKPIVGFGLLDDGDDVPGCECEVVKVRGVEVVCSEECVALDECWGGTCS